MPHDTLPPPGPAAQDPKTRQRALLALFVMAALLALRILQGAIETPTLGANGVLTDFDVFYIVGQFIWEGDPTAPYHTAKMFARQAEIIGAPSTLTWSYPPQFDLITALFALVSRGLAFGAFGLASLGFFLWVLWRLSPRQMVLPLAAVFPGLYLNSWVGQNGFLIGGLLGLVALALLAGRQARGGAALGLLAIKPHLALGPGLVILLAGQWRAVLASVLSVLATSALATLLLGPAIWDAFREGMRVAGHALSESNFQLYRMFTAYSALRSAGAPGWLASAGQGASVIAAAAMILYARARHWQLRRALAMGFAASLLISPYGYDYDLAALSIALALLAPDIARHASLASQMALVAGGWLAGGWGFVGALILAPEGGYRDPNQMPIALGFWGLALVLVLMVRTAAKAEASAA